ncbi:hypothetical protein [Streptomyces virginiae]|uniref:hypothetical protein n=1 Tax=Streptomyces virginiae TaxID=1961 RepID=UPI00341E5BD9
MSSAVPDFVHGSVCCSKPLPMPLYMTAVLPVPPTSRVTSCFAPPPPAAGAGAGPWPWSFEAAGCGCCLPPSGAGFGSALPQPVSSSAAPAHSVTAVMVLRMS